MTRSAFFRRLSPLRALAVAAAGVLSVGAIGVASHVVARPAGTALDARIAELRDGATLRLPPANYGMLTISRRQFPSGVRILAEGSRFAGIVIRQSEGVTIETGTATANPATGYAISILQSARVGIRQMTVTDAVRGIVIDRSRDVTIADNRFTGLRSDGVNVALSQQVTVERNSCRDFSPVLATFANGERVRDGDHPDCIQAWSRPTAPPVADLKIVDNVIDGNMQGIFLGNRDRDGVPDGGYDRVTITGNRVNSAMTNGIALFDCRDCTVKGNTVTTVPGSRQKRRPEIPVISLLRIERGTVVACDNSVVTPRRPMPGTAKCARPR